MIKRLIVAAALLLPVSAFAIGIIFISGGRHNPAAESEGWLLAGGLWNDAGAWDDAAMWED